MTSPSTSDEPQELDTLLSIQSVYARNLDLAAFKLIVDVPENVSRSLEDIRAFSQVVIEDYNRIYRQGQMVAVPCMLKVSREVVLDPRLLELPKAHFILELAPEIEPDSEVLNCLKILVAKGFRIAASLTPQSLDSIRPFLDTVHILRIDVSHSAEDAIALVETLRSFNLDLMADQLQSVDHFRRCVDAGFRFFSGDFLDKPQAAKGKKPTANKHLLLEVMAALQDPDITIDKLESLVLKDPDLTYRLIKVVNSAQFGIEREIDSLFYALAIIGTKQIRSLISLYLLEGHDDQPADLVRTTLVRGRMCETIAEIAGRENVVSYFVVGLLSKLDIITQIPMETLMKDVPLTRELKIALLRREGPIGAILSEVEAYERGQFSKLNILPNRAFYETAYRHSTAWARQVQSSVGETG